MILSFVTHSCYSLTFLTRYSHIFIMFINIQSYQLLGYFCLPLQPLTYPTPSELITLNATHNCLLRITQFCHYATDIPTQNLRLYEESCCILQHASIVPIYPSSSSIVPYLISCYVFIISTHLMSICVISSNQV